MYDFLLEIFGIPGKIPKNWIPFQAGNPQNSSSNWQNVSKRSEGFEVKKKAEFTDRPIADSDPSHLGAIGPEIGPEKSATEFLGGLHSSPKNSVADCLSVTPVSNPRTRGWVRFFRKSPGPRPGECTVARLLENPLIFPTAAKKLLTPGDCCRAGASPPRRAPRAVPRPGLRRLLGCRGGARRVGRVHFWEGRSG